MLLSENPFFILGITPQADRHQISAIAEEKALLLNSEKCSDARNFLTTPQKRLIAEMNWFLGCSSDTVDEIINYISALQSGSQHEEISGHDFNALAELNIKRFSFPFLPIEEIYRYKYKILELSRLFEAVDSEQIRLEINKARTVSKFAPISSTVEIEAELRNIRSELSHIIVQKLSEISDNNVAVLVTMLAEKYTLDERYSGSAVIDDVLSEYALQFALELQDLQHQIIMKIEHIYMIADDKDITAAVDELIILIKQWDTFAQPLQLYAKAKGISHEDSEDLASTVRKLAVDLNNLHTQTEISIRLNNELEKIFAEVPEFAEKFREDSITLRRLKAEQDEALQRSQTDKQNSVNSNNASLSESKQQSQVKGRAYFRPSGRLVKFLFLATFIALGNLNSLRNSQPSYSSTPTNSQTSPAAPQNNLGKQTKQQRLDAMEEELNKSKIEIENMEVELDGLLADLEYYEAEYNSSNNGTYANLYNSTLDDYNILYDKYDQAVSQYNDIVAEYNALLNNG